MSVAATATAGAAHVGVRRRGASAATERSSSARAPRSRRLDSNICSHSWRSYLLTATDSHPRRGSQPPRSPQGRCAPSLRAKVRPLPEGRKPRLAAVSSGADHPARGGDEAGRCADEPDLAALLLKGPLAATGLEEDVAAAERDQAAGEHARAAERYLDAARRLPADAAPMRARLARHAADAYEQAGERDRALMLLLELAADSLCSDDPGGASGTLREASRLAGPEKRPAVEGFFAWENWPDDPESAAAALREAMKAATVAPERWGWAERLSGLLAVTEEWEQLDELGASLRVPDLLAAGESVGVVLDWLDARERLERSDEALAQTLLAWASGQQPAVEARVRQRVAVVAARRGRIEQAVGLLREAVALWSQAGGRDEQVVEAFDAIATARRLAGEPEFAPPSVRLAERRGISATPASRARRLERRALRALAREQFIEARHDLILAAAHQRAAGNLRGEMRSRELLARLLEAGERDDEALWWAVSCGDVRRCRRLAGALGWHHAERALRPRGARWERAASWAAVAAAGAAAPVQDVERLAEPLLADAADDADADAVDAYGVMVMARDAAAAVLLQLPAGQRDEALGVLRDELISGQWAARGAADAVALLTELGISDEAHVLLEAVLGENARAVRGVAGLLIRLAGERPDVRERIVAAARGGDDEAVDIAAYAGLDEDALRERYAQRVERLLALDGPDRTSEQLISYEPTGVFARYCDPPLQDRVLSHLSGVVVDAARLEANRASAARALGNAADLVGGARAQELLAVVRPLVAPDRLGPAVGGDRFRRVRIRFGPPEMLVVAVTELAGSLAERTSRTRELATAIVHDAVVSGLPRLWTATAQALLRAPSLPDRIPAEAWLGHRDASVREWGLALVARRDPMFASAPDVARLVGDPHRRVRRALVTVAAERDDEPARALLDRLVTDPDAEVRAFARVALGQSALVGG